MLPVGLSVKFLAVGFYLSTVLYVQLRGQVRHKLGGEPQRRDARHRTLGRRMIKAAATQNLPGEHVGAALRHLRVVDAS
jgi:hypothetical protein